MSTHSEKGFFCRIRERTFFVFLFMAFFLLSSSLAFAKEEFISVSEIVPGMRGVGKTVFSGTKVDEFNVEVIDIFSGTEINHPYILVKLSGDEIEANGGISSGMSGSPVYLEGKLAGAVSHAWEMSEHNLCLITPIKNMMLLFDYLLQYQEQGYSYFIDNENVSVNLKAGLKEKLLEAIPDFGHINITKLPEQSSILNFRWIKSPLLVSGFGGRAYQLLEQKFFQRGIHTVQAIPRYQDSNRELIIETKEKDLKPGSAIGVQLSTGDVSILAIGTATYFQDHYMLAFGHPFLHAGDVSYLLSAIYIYHSFPSMVMPFKVGSPYLLLGEVIQDRETGILAELNHFPKVVSCKVAISDLDKNRIVHSGIKVIPKNDIVRDVVSALVIQSIDHAINRIGLGTAVISLDFRNAQTEEVLHMENRYFSQDDIAMECDKDFNELMDLMIHNYCESIEISEVKIDIAIEAQNRSAMIEEVKLDEKEYFPGQTIEAQLKIKPFRKSIETNSVRINLPENIATGDAILIIRGGISSEIRDEKALVPDQEKYLLNGWDGIREHIEKKVRNHQIIAELVLVNQQETLATKDLESEKANEDDLKVILDTDFIVEGYHEVYLSIVKNKENLE